MKKLILGAGILLGALVVAWMFTMGFTGWFLDAEKAGLFFLVIPIQVAVLWVLLHHTARRGNGWRDQVLAGTVASIVAAVLIFGGSMLFTAVVFPDYFTDLRAIQEQLMRQSGTSETEIQRQLELARRGQTSFSYAFSGFLGTVVTGIVASALLGVFFRARPAASQGAAA